MSALFSHAICNEWALTNPITAVRTSAERLQTPDILTPEEYQALLGELDLRSRALVLLVGATGPRRGESIALRWRDLDFENMLVNVTHSIWHSIEGGTKPDASRGPIPMPPLVAEELQSWKKSNQSTALTRTTCSRRFLRTERNLCSSPR